MKIRLVFDDWRKRGKSIYQENIDLSLGDFHSGTTFEGEIDLDIGDETELKQRLEEGYCPVFYIIKEKEVGEKRN